MRAEAAARLGRVQRRKEKLQRLIATRNDPNKWLGENDSDWEMYVRPLVLDDRTNGHAFATRLRFSVVCLSVTHVLWLNGTGKLSERGNRVA